MRRKTIITGEDGFTLVELIITMVIFVLIMAAASGVFTGLLTQFKQQSKVAETNVEGIIGLEILRQDMEQAGYGLPQNVRGVADWTAVPNYSEAVSSGSPDPATYNDGDPASALPVPANTQRAPRAVASGNNIGVNGSDYLVIKSLPVAGNSAAGKWQPIRAGSASTMKTWWAQTNEYVCRDDKGNHYPNTRTIVIFPGGTASSSRSLVVSGGSFFVYADDYSSLTNFAPPSGSPDTWIMYGVDVNTDLRAPFNRGDYYIKIPSDMPKRCAPDTGVLYKGILNHADGRLTEYPLLDCVADMQVAFSLDADGDGNIDTTTDDISALIAQQIRDQVKEIRVYILAHEGQRDTNYSYSSTTVAVPASPDPASGVGSTFDLSATIGDPDYKYYRWKLYTIVATPNNLK